MAIDVNTVLSSFNEKGTLLKAIKDLYDIVDKYGIEDISAIKTAANSALELAQENAEEIEDLTTSVAGKQDTLVSGTNIKTINSNSILGSGNITISGGDGGSMDAESLAESGATLSLTITHAGAYYFPISSGFNQISFAFPNEVGNKSYNYIFYFPTWNVGTYDRPVISLPATSIYKVTYASSTGTYLGTGYNLRMVSTSPDNALAIKLTGNHNNGYICDIVTSAIAD